MIYLLGILNALLWKRFLPTTTKKDASHYMAEEKGILLVPACHWYIFFKLLYIITSQP